jgi:hypothetical protein
MLIQCGEDILRNSTSSVTSSAWKVINGSPLVAEEIIRLVKHRTDSKGLGFSNYHQMTCTFRQDLRGDEVFDELDSLTLVLMLPEGRNRHLLFKTIQLRPVSLSKAITRTATPGAPRFML